jgi:signal peptidase I
MEPTLAVGDVVYVVTGGSPTLGAVVVFHPPAGAENQICGAHNYPNAEVCPRPTPQEATSTNYIKRVVAGPGDTIAIRAGHVILNGKRQNEPYASFMDCNTTVVDCNYPRPFKVPAGYYFVLGDSRDFSHDSRFWGPVPRSWIEGRAETVCVAPDATCRPLG